MHHFLRQLTTILTRCLFLAGLVAVSLAFAPAARASGPPYAVVMDQAVGPYVVSIWFHPNLGEGVIYVIFDPAHGGPVPEDMVVEIAVQPADGQLPETRYRAERQVQDDKVQYVASVQLNARGMWQVRVRLNCSQGKGEVRTEVESTLPGLGPIDLLVYGIPFVAIAVVWLLAAMRWRRRRPDATVPNLSGPAETNSQPATIQRSLAAVERELEESPLGVRRDGP